MVLLVGVCFVPTIQGYDAFFTDENSKEHRNMLSHPVPVKEELLTFYPTDDTTVKQTNPFGDYGERKQLQVRNEYGFDGVSAWGWNSFVKFDLSSIPTDSIVLNAELYLYYFEYQDTRPNTRFVNLYPVLEEWDEEDINWYTQPDCMNISPSKSSSFRFFGWVSWNVTRDVQCFIDGSMMNHGWKLIDDYYWGKYNIPGIIFYSKECENEEYIPYLEVEIAEPVFVIEDINGGKGITADISNVGNADASEIEWMISVEPESFGMVFGKQTTGEIDSLDVDESVRIESSSLFGFGSMLITVQIADVEKKANGFLLGPFVMNLD